MKKALATFSAVLLFASAQTHADEWRFSIEPYLLAANIEGDAGMGRIMGAPIDVDFSKILETLDIGAMLHFEAHSANGWGVILDYAFMDLSDDIFGSRGGIVDARVRQGTFEALLVKQSRSQSSGLEYFAGIRWWDNKISVAVDPAILPGDITRKIDASWIDLVVGARWTRPLSERWQLQIKGDVGGFGVEADFTSSLAVAGVYRFSERYALDLQYKALWVDFEDGTAGQPNSFSYDTITHGPIVGFKIDF